MWRWVPAVSTPRPEQALRDVSDGLLSDLDLLVQLEQRKRLLKPDDPEANDVARQVAVIAERVLRRSISEEQLTRHAHEAAKSGDEDAPTRSINETPRAIHAILEDWRAAERRLTAAAAGTPEHAAAARDCEQFRVEYQRSFNQRSQSRER